MDENRAIFDQLNYEVFLAEQSMKMELKRIDRKAESLTETAEIVVLNESVADAIRKYMRSVTLSMQKAWNSFKGKFDAKQIALVLNEKNEQYFKNDFDMACPDDFQYPKLNEWIDIRDNCQIGQTELNSANYTQMSEFLESPDKFLAQYYPNYIEKDGENQLSISEAFQKRCFSTVQPGYVIKNDLANKYKDYLKSFTAEGGDIKAIQADIEAMNKVNDNVDSMLKEVVGESVSYIGHILLEDGKDPNNSFRDAHADPNDPDAGKNKGAKDRANIVNYYKAMTSILSAKMRTSSKVKNTSLRIVTNYITVQGGSILPKIKKPENTQTANVNNGSVPKVK